VLSIEKINQNLRKAKTHYRKMALDITPAIQKIKGFIQRTNKLAVAEIKSKIAAPLKRAEDTLRDNEAMHRTLLENLPQKIFFKNKDSVYVSCNENYARDLGIKADKITEKTDYDLFPRKLADKFRADDKSIMESGKIEDIEESYVHGEQERFVHIVKTPVKDEKANIIGVLGILWDITERKELKKHLIEAEKLATVGRLAAGVAHEMNNPLASILLNVQMMAHRIKKDVKDIPDSKEYVKTLEKVEGAVNRCKGIVAGLLAYSRPSKLQLDKTDINKLIKETLQSLEKQVKSGNVRVIKDFAVHLPKIIADGQQLSVVFKDLIINACEALSKGGELRITTRLFQKPETKAPGEVIGGGKKILEIEFSDTGKGIPEEDLPRIFDPFFTTKDRGEGVGLGLAISYGIIKEHEGSIEVTSEKDKGTTFIVRLPVSNTAG